MQWYDVGAYVLMAIGGLALVGLAWAVIQLVVMCVAGFWPRKEEPVRVEETSMGSFRSMGARWIADSVMGRDLTVWVNDDAGKPDPYFVEGLSDLFAALPPYERRAREFEPELDEEGYTLTGINQASPVYQEGAEFELDFSHPEHDQLGWEIVFKGGQPVESNPYDNH